MFMDYLANAVKHVEEHDFPANPLHDRAVILPDGTMSVADSDDFLPSEVKDPVDFVGFSDTVRAGEKPAVLGALHGMNRLSDADFSRRFIHAFNAAGQIKDLQEQNNANPVNPVTNE